jgi:hypothetical protein
LEIFLNDLSVAGQFADPAEFRTALQPLMQLRARRADLQRMLYCSSTFSLRPVTPVRSVREAIVETRDRLFIGLVLEWLGKSGPFWDADRFPNADDYFEFEEEDVTDQGLGEASRRRLGTLDSGVFSFIGGSSDRFKRTPLSVTHGLKEAPLGIVEVPNIWSLDDLEKVADSRPESWKSMLDMVVERFDLLSISPEILSHLDGQPFHAGIADRVFALLNVLNRLAHETKGNGSFTAGGIEIWQQHTVGDKAWFTDESDANKIEFESQLKFKDHQTGSKLFCSWHGKIKINQFRIHFEWPRPTGQRLIKVMYVGPKITKK